MPEADRRQSTTGPIVIADAFARGRGLAFVCIGIVLLLYSAALHANPFHAVAALVFAVGIGALHLIAGVNRSLFTERWRRALRLTEWLSLLVLGATTFSPLLIVAAHGQPGWDVMVLGGIVLVWWNVMDLLIADYRRVIALLAALAVAWLPVALWHPPTWEVAYGAAGLGTLATLLTALALRRSLNGVPRQYRRLDLTEED